MKTFWLSLIVISATACVHPRVKFQKAQLLDPTMDPAKTSGLAQGTTDGVMIGAPERGLTAGGSSGSSSCPTCGG